MDKKPEATRHSMACRREFEGVLLAEIDKKAEGKRYELYLYREHPEHLGAYVCGKFVYGPMEREQETAIGVLMDARSVVSFFKGTPYARELLVEGGILRENDPLYQPEEVSVDRSNIIPLSERVFRKDQVQELTLFKSDGPDLKFQGWLIAQVRRSEGNDSCSYLSLCIADRKTVTYVCSKVREYKAVGKKEGEVHMAYNINEVFNFFGWGSFAKELYWKAGIDCTENPWEGECRDQ